MSRSFIAKLTKPDLAHTFPRPRLADELERLAQRHSILWVSAPAGSGKTTLAASYLEARQGRHLWYQVDIRDAEAATFFYYLREAALHLAPEQEHSLPLLTPEYQLGLEAYARHFFERLGAGLPVGTTIVIDNYHELPESAPLQRVLPLGLATLPAGFPTVVLSRAPPPPPFSRLVAQRSVGFLEAEQLNLTDAEVFALARRVRGSACEEREVHSLRMRTGGWVAGTLLLLEAPSRALPPSQGEQTAEEQVLFDYFAAESFQELDLRAQNLLLGTALLPAVDLGVAEQLASEPCAGELLADLARRNFFTLRLAGEPPRYRYHPLFRDFLTARARRLLPPSRWVELAERSADLSIAAGNVDEAAAILMDVGSSERLAALINREAPTLGRQGRWGALERWLRALPSAMLESDAWLSYWMGLSQSTRPSQARLQLGRAYHLFEALGDVEGMLIAWAGVVATYFYVWDEFATLRPWIERMTRLQSRIVRFPSVETEARVTFGMFASLVWCHSTHPELAAWRGRAYALLDSAAPPEIRMQLAAYLAFYATSWIGDYAATELLLERTRPLLLEPAVTPLTQMLWYIMLAHHRARLGDSAGSLLSVRRGLDIASDRGVLGLNHIVAIQGVWGALSGGDLATAKTYYAMAASGLGDAKANGVHLHMLGAWVAIVDEDLSSANAHARRACELAEQSGTDIAAPWAEHTLAQVLIEQGEPEPALSLLREGVAWSHRIGDRAALHHVLLSMAYAEIRRGDIAAALPYLRDGMRIGREQGYIVHPWIGWRKDVLARLAALALSEDIETPHVRAQIRAQGLRPPDLRAPPRNWPWAVEVRALGRLEVRVDGELLMFPRKAPRKPLELLTALIGFGGCDIPDARLADVLWPDLEGDAAIHALEVATSRLRRILRSAHAIVRHDRSSSLDPALVWVDALALRRELERVSRAAASPGVDIVRLERDAATLFSLHAGPLVNVGDRAAPLPLARTLRSGLSNFVKSFCERMAAEGVSQADPRLWRAWEIERELASVLCPAKEVW